MTEPRRFDLALFLHWFKAIPWLAIPFALGNLLAVYWGWTDYYAPQLRRTPIEWWIFVPDSPNAVLSFAAVLLLYQVQRRRYAVLDLLAWVLNIKVGLWTAFVLLYYYEGFFPPERAALQWFLFALHIGMVAQSFVLHRDLRLGRPSAMAYGVVTAWVAIGDLLDYFLPLRTCGNRPGIGIHPCMPGEPMPVVGTVTMLLSAATLVAAFLLYTPRRGNQGPSSPGSKTDPSERV